MILTKNKILDEINKKRIKITPFDKTSIGPASIDLRLGDEVRIFKNKNNKIKAIDSFDYKKITKKISIKKGHTLKPGDLVLGITKEKITLPNDICGWLNSRSRFARLGLMVHITAPFIQPGVSNKQVLEIYNAGPQDIVLIPKTKLCQFIFQRCEGNAQYQGKFKSQNL